MSNIQLFEQAFVLTFPVETANQLLGHMQALYGDTFNKKFGEIEQERMISTVCQVLDGLKPEDLQRGVQRMKTEKWCPSIPEFRTWCLQDRDWWTAEQAWAKVLNYLNDPTEKITTLAKRSLDEVRHVLRTEGQKSAHYAFKDIYEDYLQQAKRIGRVQVLWIDPKPQARIEQPEQRKSMPPPPELSQSIQLIYKRGGRAS